MVSHNRISVQLIVPQALAAEVNGVHNDLRDLWISQVEVAGTGAIQIAIDPNECLTGFEFSRWREAGDWQTPVEVPGEK
jgi:hypothetical protein